MTRIGMLAFGLGLSSLMVGCGGKKKSPENAAPQVGWVQEEGWMGSCWVAPDFSGMGMGERRIARSETMDAIMGQWRGDRGDGVSFDERTITNVETQLLRFPDKIEKAAAGNLEQCRKAMAGGGTGAWSSWLETLPRQLLAGECTTPLDVVMYNYIELGTAWQFPAGVCEGDPIKITASRNDYFKISDDGPWINADGDPALPAAGGDYLCTTEGCFAGQLVLRWRGTDGAEIIRPLGTSLVFTPPGHGTIEIAINDTTLYDNEWKVERGVKHRTQITYEPAE